MEPFDTDRVEQFIRDISLCVETSRDLCERVCQDLRPLLYQPWPPNEKLLKSSVPLTRGDAGNHGDGVSLEEAETLAEVERALVKAQRARELTRRLNPLDEICQESDASLPNNNQPVEENLHVPPTKQLINGQEFAVISQSSLQRLFADVRPQDPNKNSRTVGKGTNLAPKPRPGTAQARAAYSAKVPRPQPSVKSQFKTTSAEIGRNVISKPKANSASNKHANTKRKLTGIKSCQEVTEKRNGSRSLSSNSADTFKKPNNTGSKRQQSNTKESTPDNQKSGRLKSDTKQSKPTSGSAFREKQATEFPEASEAVCQNSLSGQMRVVRDQSVTGTGNLVQKTSKLKLGDSTPKPPMSDGTGDRGSSAKGESPRSFMLKRDGCDLKVPGKLKKLHSDISKLRYRLSSEEASDEVSLASQHFLHRLESKFQSSSTTPSIREVQERIDELTAKCRHLIQVAKTALKTYPKQDATWESRYRMEILTKSTRTKLDELNVQVQNITAAEKQLLASSHTRQHSVNPPSPSECRTCESASSDPSITFFLPIQRGDSQGCISQLGSGRGRHRNYEYSNLKELQALATLQHDAQRLSLQIQLEKLVGDEMLPILESLDASDSHFVTLYRSLYGLLCHGGKIYPAIVGDNVGNASEIET